jgi:hypothetical protein
VNYYPHKDKKTQTLNFLGRDFYSVPFLSALVKSEKSPISLFLPAVNWNDQHFETI